MEKLKLWGFWLFIFGVVLILPKTVLAEADFDSILTDGKLVVHSVKPTSQEMAYTVIDEYTLYTKYPDYYMEWGSCNEDFTKCKIYYNADTSNDPSKEVEISYVYDEDVKLVVDALIKKLDGKDTFNLTDIEFINYLVNVSAGSSMINYSSELKKAIDYKNFSIDVRLGDGADFYTEKGGNANFVYDDTFYYIKPHTSAEAKHIIYVDTNTTDVLEAIKTRLTKIFGTDFNVKETDTVANFLESEKDYFRENYNQELSYFQGQGYRTEEEYVNAKMNENYYNEDAEYSFVTRKDIYEKYYTLTINGNDFKFLVVKDSSKINDNVEIITNDVGSNITISTSSTSIPLDTLIKVLKLTSGEEYEKIIKTLNVTNSETFDLSLYSNSISKNITTGNFEVKIPITDNLKDKNLVVYYVTSEGKIEEYEVTVKDGYAIFTTNHFSIYTLAEKISSTAEEIEEVIDNPKTNDNINSYVLLSVIALGIIGLSSNRLNNRKRINNI